jgi:hypothetical protein
MHRSNAAAIVKFPEKGGIRTKVIHKVKITQNKAQTEGLIRAHRIIALVIAARPAEKVELLQFRTKFATDPTWETNVRYR